ncbi:MAG TPA: hypothetical protein VM680_19360 [Verrucomicrobiae bacterium]|nr:hypothetical protein [Verrucomicrobiae bacterium]
MQLLQSQEPGGQVQGLHVHCAAALRLVVFDWRFVFDFIVVNSFVVGATGFELFESFVAFHKG